MKKFLIAAAVMALVTGIASAADAPAMKRSELQKSPVPGGKFVAMVMAIDGDKGGATGWHTHPGEEVGVAISGQLTVQVKGQPDRIVKAGESFRIPANTPHNGMAGPEGYKGTGIYIIDSDKPLATPVAAP